MKGRVTKMEQERNKPAPQAGSFAAALRIPNPSQNVFSSARKRCERGRTQKDANPGRVIKNLFYFYEKVPHGLKKTRVFLLKKSSFSFFLGKNHKFYMDI